jgi:hypothetical protein
MSAGRLKLPAADDIDIADDLIEGVDAIAEFIGKKPRAVFLLCNAQEIPAFKLLGRWHMRKSRYRRHIAELEDAALARAPGHIPAEAAE